MWGKLWWLFKVSCKETIKYGWDILTMLLAVAFISPLVIGDVSLLRVSIGCWILVVIFVVLCMMYMISDEWIIVNIRKK